VIKFILTVLILVDNPRGGSIQSIREEFKTNLTCEQAKAFTIEEVNKTKDAVVISASCVKVTEV
jgi:hypothetical protein